MKTKILALLLLVASAGLVLLRPQTAWAKDLNSQLLDAVADGDTVHALETLGQGADPNTYDESDPKENTALSLAIRANNAKLVKALLDKGADPNLYYNPENCPTLMASQGKNDEILAAILAAGGKATFLQEIKSPLDFARERMGGGGFYVDYAFYQPSMLANLKSAFSGLTQVNFNTLAVGVKFTSALNLEYRSSFGSASFNGQKMTFGSSDYAFFLQFPFNQPFGSSGPMQFSFVCPIGIAFNSLSYNKNNYWSMDENTGVGLGLKFCTRSFFSIDAAAIYNLGLFNLFGLKEVVGLQSTTNAGTTSYNTNYLTGPNGKEVMGDVGGFEFRLGATLYLWGFSR